MWTKGKRLSLTIFLAVLLAFTGCGEAEETSASSVDVFYFPEGVANIHLSDFTTDLGDGDEDEVTIVGPWFFISLAGFNGSEKVLFIASMEILCTDSKGNESTWTPDLEEGTLGIAFALPNESLIWKPNTQAEGAIGPNSVLLYVDSLSDNGGLRYRCTAKFEGWFYGKEDDPETDVDETILPEENFRKEITFRARYQK